MGPDIWIAIVAVSSSALAAFLAARQFTSKRPWVGSLAFTTSLGVCLAFAFLSSGKLGWATWFPDGAAVYWSNGMPFLLAISAGLAVRAPGLVRWHRPLTVVVLGCLGAGYVVAPIVPPLLIPAKVTGGSGDWNEEICLQSHPATCAPAAAATLLRMNGIPATEAAMVDACLTSARGTLPLGLYRGVLLEADRRGRRVGIASTDPDQWIREGQLPAVALIRLEEIPNVNSNPGPLTRLLGTRGEGHAIVVLGHTDAGRWIIGDPAVGRIVWTDQELRSRFTGEALFIK